MIARLPCAAALLLAAGCDMAPESAGSAPESGGSAPPAGGLRFVEVAEAAGLDFVHRNGAAGSFLLPEIMCGGAGFVDYDGDGLLDAYLVQSGRPGAPDATLANRLFRNDGAGGFVDVTAAAGVGDTGYGMGCAAGDYDGDGHVDLYVTNLGRNVLYRNRGDGSFVDVTAAAGAGDEGWSTSAAFVDHDGDGDLDLFVVNYVDWSDLPAFTAKRCFAATGARDYCSPQAYDAPSYDTLYRNDGDGTFTDVSDAAGIRARAGTGLGVVCADLNGDGAIDIYVANDQMPSFAWINSGEGSFTEEAVPMSIAVDEVGKSQAGMGVDAADVDGDGAPDLWKVHLHRESHILYLNRGDYFDDVTTRWGLGAATRQFTGFGTALIDLDLDGLLDGFVANGRVQFVAAAAEVDDIYAEPNQLLRQSRPGWFEDVTADGGAALALVENSRAAAFGDFDNDGDLDVLVANCNGPARLLRNETRRRGAHLTLRVVDRNGADAYGARVACTVGDDVRFFDVRAAFGYCATNDPRVHVGLGDAERVDRIEVRWPDGATAAFGPFEPDTFQVLTPPPVAGGAAGPATSDTPATGQPQRPEFEAIAARLRDGHNQYLGRAQVHEIRRRLATPGPMSADRLRALIRLAVEEARIGEVDRAIETVELARSASEVGDVPQGLRVAIHRVRGLVYLRKAEIENCVARHNRDCCIFPLQDGGVHTEQAPARRAMASYLVCAEAKPDDLKLRWLLNLVAMALGEYPDRVPERHRIPAAVFASARDVGRFVDVAPALGLDAFNLCGGCIVEDFDRDGLLDIVTSTYDPEGPMTYYANLGDGRFEDRSARSRLDDQLGGLNCIGGDYDGDGDVDILVLRGAWLFDDGRIRNSLLRNEGDGTFTDVTRAAGLAAPAAPTQAAAWADFDLDGDLDLYVGNESRTGLGDQTGDYPGQLFRNEGDGSFTDVAGEAGVTNDRYCKGVAAGDYDDDGDMDLYISNIGPNRLYRNDGGLRFTDVAVKLGVTEPLGRSFASWFFDYDNDGDLDLFVTGYDAKVEQVAADYLDLPQTATPPCLYRNDGDAFTNVATEVGLDHAYLPMGANFGDLDNDGWLDIYLATGDPDFQTLMPNVMLRNDRGVFENVTTSAGLGHLQKGHGVSFADIDHDGDQDIYHQLGGFYPGDAFSNALFLNPGHGNRHLTIELVGVRTNRAGAGARVTVTLETPDGRRSVHRAAGSVSSFGGSPSRLEIGLGDATAIERVEVWWPVSGDRQVLDGVPLDAAVRVTEGQDGLELLEYRRVPIAP